MLRWVNHADLIRVVGVGPEFAELLEAAGVDSVPELAQRNVENLVTALAETNEARNLVRRVPSAAEVSRLDRAGEGASARRRSLRGERA